MTNETPTSPSPSTTAGTESELVAAAREALPVMARAFERIHSMPRVSDSALADQIVKAKEALRLALKAEAQPTTGREELAVSIKAALLGTVRAELRGNALTGEPYAAVAGLNNATARVMEIISAPFETGAKS